MKKCFLFLALTASTGMFGQSFFSIVGNGTGSNGNTGYPAPYGNYYFGAKHQLYVTPQELINSGVGAGSSIKALGFNILNLNTMTGQHINWSVVVYTTSSTNPLTGGFISTGGVSSSTITNAVGVLGWNMTNIAPFTWDGVSGLVIETCFNNTGYVYNLSHEWTTNLSGATFSIWRNADAAGQCTMPFTTSSTNTRPNIRFEWEYTTPCTGAPAPNSILAPTFAICPNSTVGLSIANTYTVGGLKYQWQESILSSVGPFTNVAVGNGTYIAYQTPSLNVNTYYQLVITCPNSGTTISAPASITIAPVTTDTVPYYENFELIGVNDRLPNCSWAGSGMLSTTRTYTQSNTGNRVPRSGTSFATFTNTPGTHYFYTNGIYMEPGITYSTSMWYTTDLTGATNWNNLGIYLGTSQTSVGLVPLATVNGAVVSPVYKSLSNTFTVGASGLYHLAVKVTAAAGNAQYLSWDDLAIEIPCQVSPNTPTITLSASQTTICQGTSITLTGIASVPVHWPDNTTSISTSFVDTPFSSTTYNVAGTSPLTGCMNSASVFVKVNLSPQVSAVANPVAVCAGKPLTLMASGAATYAWSSGAVGSVVNVTPSGNTTYNVIGTSTNNCTGNASISVTVNPLPNVTSSADRLEICRNEGVSITGGGAVTYRWVNSISPNVFQGSTILVYPGAPSVYTVTGTNANGCENTSVISINVNECTGISENNISASTVRVYPNPSSGTFNIEKAGSVGSIVVTDVTGRIVLQKEETSSHAVISLEKSAAGIYYVKISNNGVQEVIKIVKD